MSVEELFGEDEADSEADEEDENDVPSEHDDDSDFEGGEPSPAPARDDPAPEPQQAPSHQNNVEEDGHTKAEGADYRQPRPSFSGCAWSGTRNVFIRTDEENTPKPRGSRPQGYTWLVSIGDFRRIYPGPVLDKVLFWTTFPKRLFITFMNLRESAPSTTACPWPLRVSAGDRARPWALRALLRREEAPP